jgi:Tetracyclin repressor-like, C-terminal domain
VPPRVRQRHDLARDPTCLGAAQRSAAPASVRAKRLHGLISLELSGSFESMALDPEQLFEAELAALLG